MKKIVIFVTSEFLRLFERFLAPKGIYYSMVASEHEKIHAATLMTITQNVKTGRTIEARRMISFTPFPQHTDSSQKK